MPIFAYLTSISTPLHLTNNNVLLVACRGHRHGHFFGAPCAPLVLVGLAPHSAAGRKFWGLEQKIRSAARNHELPSSRAAAARDGAVLCSTPCFCLVLCCGSLSSCRSPRVAFDARAPEQVGRSPARSRNARISNNAPQELLVVFTEDLFFPLPLPGAAGFKNYGPAHQCRGIACTVLEPAL